MVMVGRGLRDCAGASPSSAGGIPQCKLIVESRPAAGGCPYEVMPGPQSRRSQELAKVESFVRPWLRRDVF